MQAGNGPLAPQLLHLLERFPRDDGLVGVWHDDPFVLGKGHDFFGFVAGLFVPPLHKIARIGLVGQDRTDGGIRPKTDDPACMTGNKVQSLLLFVAGRAGDAFFVQRFGDPRCAVPGQHHAEDTPYHGGGHRVNDQMVVVGGVFGVAVGGEGADVLAGLAFVGQHRADVDGKIFEIPLVDQAVDLPCFLVAGVIGVRMIHQCNKADAPFRELAVQIPFHQLHIAGESGLAFGEHNIEFVLAGILDQPAEGRAVPVCAGIVLIGIDIVDIVPPLYGVLDQKRLLILDAFGLLFSADLFADVIILLAESDINGNFHSEHSFLLVAQSLICIVRRVCRASNNIRPVVCCPGALPVAPKHSCDVFLHQPPQVALAFPQRGGLKNLLNFVVR